MWFHFFAGFFSWLIAWPIPETGVSGSKPFRPSVIINHFRDLFYLLMRKELDATLESIVSEVGGFYLVLVKISGR